MSSSSSENTLGVWGFIISLVSILLCGGLLSPVGLIMSLVAMRREPRGFATAGVVLGAIGLCVGFIGVFFFFGAIVSLLAGLGLAGVAAAMGGPTIEAQSDMAQIDRALYQAQQAGQAAPATLDGLALDTPTLTDPWGNRYLYTPNADGSWQLTSNGEDGQAGTADDIVFGEGPYTIHLR